MLDAIQRALKRDEVVRQQQSGLAELRKRYESDGAFGGRNRRISRAWCVVVQQLS